MSPDIKLAIEQTEHKLQEAIDMMNTFAHRDIHYQPKIVFKNNQRYLVSSKVIPIDKDNPLDGARLSRGD